jgi:hypothetical protein
MIYKANTDYLPKTPENTTNNNIKTNNTATYSVAATAICSNILIVNFKEG